MECLRLLVCSLYCIVCIWPLCQLDELTHISTDTSIERERERKRKTKKYKCNTNARTHRDSIIWNVQSTLCSPLCVRVCVCVRTVHFQSFGTEANHIYKLYSIIGTNTKYPNENDMPSSTAQRQNNKRRRLKFVIGIEIYMEIR